MFGLEVFHEVETAKRPFVTDKSLCLVNARSGIALLIDLLSPAHLWVPSYLCEAILKAVNRSKTSLQFYKVNYDLAMATQAWIEDVQPGDLVLLIDYFGFLHDSFSAIELKERGAWFLEDACQALLTEGVGQYADFVMYSPRKFLGVPDGGVLVFNGTKDIGQVDLASVPTKWWLKSLSAAVMRREFDICGGKRSWFKMFKQAEKESPIGPYAMSELSRALLRSVFDYSAIADRRVKNYKILLEELCHIALFPELPGHVVPLGFPIRIRNRDQLREVLFEHDIYPPLHWEIKGVVPDEFKDSHKLAGHIMTLPCDQRYDAEDMHRMARLVLSGLKT
jgi:dTDP-4-amino-4,6-dideoxygalactose transaminase